MSHFVGLVCITPKYLEENPSYDFDEALEESLEPYNEEKSVPEYASGDVSEHEKVSFVTAYCKDKKEMTEHIRTLYKEAREKKLGWAEIQEYVTKKMKEKYPNILKNFARLYRKNGEDWNGKRWRYNGSKWVAYSTYNPDSKWDWFDVGGRWHKGILLKDGTFVNECVLDEIDWEPSKTKSEDWRLSSQNPAYAIIIDGEWHERGRVGWFGTSFDEVKNWNETFNALVEGLPKDTRVALVDFHI